MSDLSPEQPRPKKRKWWRTAGILALLLVGWCAVRESEKKPETGSEKSVAESEKKPVAKSEKSVKEAQTSTPKQLPSTQSQTKSVEDDVNRLQSTKNDIETKMDLVTTEIVITNILISLHVTINGQRGKVRSMTN